jgi:hypothetical protein
MVRGVAEVTLWKTRQTRRSKCHLLDDKRDWFAAYGRLAAVAAASGWEEF